MSATQHKHWTFTWRSTSIALEERQEVEEVVCTYLQAMQVSWGIQVVILPIHWPNLTMLATAQKRYMSYVIKTESQLLAAPWYILTHNWVPGTYMWVMKNLLFHQWHAGTSYMYFKVGVLYRCQPMGQCITSMAPNGSKVRVKKLKQSRHFAPGQVEKQWPTAAETGKHNTLARYKHYGPLNEKSLLWLHASFKHCNWDMFQELCGTAFY